MPVWFCRMFSEAMLKSVLLLFTLLLPQVQEIDEKALEWFRQGEAMIGTESQFSEEQARCFREALAVSPRFSEARYNLVLILLAREAFQEAEEQSSLLITTENGSLQGYLLRAEARLMLGRIDEASGDLDVFLEKYPGDARGRELQGDVFFRKGSFSEAADAYRSALELGRDSLGIRINIGLSFLNSGENQLAAEAFKGLTAAFPEAWEGYYWRGVALRAMGGLEEAAASLEKAENLAPDNEKIREELIEVFLGLGELEKAGIRINSKKNRTARDYSNLALLARAEGNIDDALAYFRTAAGLDPGNADILAGLGDVQVDAGETREAMDSYRRSLELNPADFTTLLSLGGLLADEGSLEESRKFLEQAVSMEPGSAEAHFRLALVLDKMKDFAPAREEYVKTLELGYRSLVAHFRLGFFLAEEGELERAMKHLTIAVSGDPGKFMPFLIGEVRKVHSTLDKIRYTAPFSDLIDRYREYWGSEEEDREGEEIPDPEPPAWR